MAARPTLEFYSFRVRRNNPRVPSLKVQVAMLAAMLTVVKPAGNFCGMIFQTIWLKVSLLFCVNPPMHLCNNSSIVRLS